MLQGSHIALMCFIMFSKQTATFALHNIKQTGFV